MSALILKLMGTDGPGLRGTTDPNGNQAFSLFDLGNLAGKRDRDDQYGKNIFYRLIKDGSKFKHEVLALCIYLKFPGKYGDNGKAARKEFSRLIQNASEYQQEVAALCRYLKFSIT